MKNQDYTIQLTVDLSVKEAFDRINTVSAWWNKGLKGSSTNLNDEFTVQFGDVHISTQKLIELIPDKKVVWLVTDSKLNFVENKHEWTNTKIVFEVSNHDNKTVVLFTHQGLVPAFQCYGSCTKGWDYYIEGSLYTFLTEGKGTPEL